MATTTRRPALEAQRLPAPIAAAAVGASVLFAVALQVRPEYAIAGVALLAAVALLRFASPVTVVVGILIFLPFQDIVISHVPTAAALAVRYAPEAAADLLALILVVRDPRRLGRAGFLGAVTGAVVLFFVLTGIWSSVPFSVIGAGVRSEFRFLALAIVVLYFRRGDDDIRRVARTILWLAAAESVIGVFEFAGGPAVARVFAPHYEISVGGVTVGKAAPPLDTVFGTFAHRNDLGAFLAFAWAVVAAAGAAGLRLTRGTTFALGSLIAVGVVVSGSREGGIALLVVALVIARQKLRFPAVGVTAALAVSAVMLTLALVPDRASADHYNVDPEGNVYRYLHSSSLVDRWSSVISREAWTPSYYTNFRLYFLVSAIEHVAVNRPVLGYGIGTVSAPARLDSPDNPVLLTEAGRRAAEFGFVYDGNWALLALEVGFGGLLALAFLVGSMVVAGLRRARAHWSGNALAASALAVAMLGFFAPTLQHRAPTVILWLLVGFVAATGTRRRVA